MLKPRLVAATLLALVVAIPTAAQAANAYRSTSTKDPIGDVRRLASGAKVVDPAIDIYKLVGYRYAKNFQLTVTFKHLTNATYTHRLVGLADIYSGDMARSTLIDLSVDGAGRARTVVSVEKDNLTTGDYSSYVLPCAGARAAADFTSSKITYTLPVACFTNYDQSQANVFVSAGRWQSTNWRSSIGASLDPFNLDETYYDDDLWIWDRDPAPRPQRSSAVTNQPHLWS